MVSNDSKLPNSARNAIKKILAAAAENGGGRRYRRHFLFKYFLLIYLKRFCLNIFKSLGEALNLRYTLINENLKKMTKLVIRGKNFEKNNMVLNDSKLPIRREMQ